VDLFVEGVAPVVPRTVAERGRARRVVARFATDAEDLKYLLNLTGLWPRDDAEALPLTPTPSWDGGRS
jgi:hypothetical protein